MTTSAFMTIAHRGASAYAPENTVAAFDLAVEQGVKHIELDLHASADGRLVIIHDSRLDRTTDGTGPVAEHAWADLARLDAGAWFHPRFAGERIPLLDAVLDRYPGTRLHLELKASRADLPRRVAEMVCARGAMDRVTVTSFDLDRVLQAREQAPGVEAAWLVRSLDKATRARARQADIAKLSPHARLLTPAIVAELHAEGFLVRAYGVPTEEVMHAVLRSGVDGMTIDFPDRLLAAVRGGD